jgi:hypothetical protein
MFGAGLLLGLAAIAAEIGWLERPASLLMALAIAALPVGMIVDWRRATRAQRPAVKGRSKTRTRPAGGAVPRPARSRKPASSKR